MRLPNETQYAAMARVINAYAITYGGTGTEAHQRRAALACTAIAHGLLDKIPEEFLAAASIEQIVIAGTEEELAEIEAMTAGAVGTGLTALEKLEDVGVTFMENDADESVRIMVDSTAAMNLRIAEGIYLHSDDANAISDARVAKAITELAEKHAADKTADDALDGETEDGAEEDPDSFEPELQKRTVVQLRGIASDLDVKTESKWSKQELVDAILNSASPELLEVALDEHPV